MLDVAEIHYLHQDVIVHSNPLLDDDQETVLKNEREFAIASVAVNVVAEVIDGIGFRSSSSYCAVASRLWGS
jgi:hypothetical protein